MISPGTNFSLAQTQQKVVNQPPKCVADSEKGEMIPREIVDQIFSAGIFSPFSHVSDAFHGDCNAQGYSDVKKVRAFLNFRLIDKAVNKSIVEFCSLETQKYNLHGDVNTVKLYCHIRSYSSDDGTVAEGAHITYVDSKSGIDPLPYAPANPRLGSELRICGNCGAKDGFLELYMGRTETYWACLRECQDGNVDDEL